MLSPLKQFIHFTFSSDGQTRRAWQFTEGLCDLVGITAEDMVEQFAGTSTRTNFEIGVNTRIDWKAPAGCTTNAGSVRSTLGRSFYDAFQYWGYSGAGTLRDALFRGWLNDIFTTIIELPNDFPDAADFYATLVARTVVRCPMEGPGWFTITLKNKLNANGMYNGCTPP